METGEERGLDPLSLLDASLLGGTSWLGRHSWGVPQRQLRRDPGMVCSLYRELRALLGRLEDR